MKSGERDQVIEQLRGLCLLGVVAIHVGSLAAEAGNFSLYVLLEVLSRYSVPAFFFISGYGLFCGASPLTAEASSLRGGYLPYLKKRLVHCGLPYVVWSLLYLAYFGAILPPGSVSFAPKQLAFVLFFGLACYHLYFMVILLWSYALLPLWQRLLQLLCRRPGLGLALLFLFQLAFNFWTCHPHLDTSNWPLWAQNFFLYRLNYLPLHYLFVFLLGALGGLYREKAAALLRRYAAAVLLFFAAAAGWDVYSCYGSFTLDGYTLTELANTYHQLSPQGLVYTAASLLCFCLLLLLLEKAQKKSRPLALLSRSLDVLGSYSLFIYLLHPLVLDRLTSFLHHFSIVPTVKKVCLAYCIVVAGSLLLSWLLSRLCRQVKLLSLFLTGRK